MYQKTVENNNKTSIIPNNYTKRHKHPIAPYVGWTFFLHDYLKWALKRTKKKTWSERGLEGRSRKGRMKGRPGRRKNDKEGKEKA